MKNFFNELTVGLKGEFDIRTFSPLALAYIGDSIFDICVRTYILQKANTTPNKLHNKAKAYVNAKSQSEMYKRIIDLVSDEEAAILKRGRNANVKSVAKNATLADYKNATGLEALFGYLYLNGETNRILEIFNLCLESLESLEN